MIARPTLALTLALALALPSAALGAERAIGPYTVTDTVTQDVAAGRTTATYVVVVPDAALVKDVSHVSVTVAVCTPTRELIVTGGGQYSPTGDPSIDVTVPLVKWDFPVSGGETKTFSYAVEGIWQPVATTMFLKAGQTAHQGTVLGIGCTAPKPPDPPVVPPVAPPEEPGAETPLTAPGVLTPAEQIVLGERVVPGRARLIGATGCRFAPFTVRVVGVRMRSVVFRLDGRVVRSVSSPRRVYRLRINPTRLTLGVHRIMATVRFRDNSPRTRSYRLSFQRCARALQAPRFTG